MSFSRNPNRGFSTPYSPTAQKRNLSFDTNNNNASSRIDGEENWDDEIKVPSATVAKQTSALENASTSSSSSFQFEPKRIITESVYEQSGTKSHNWSRSDDNNRPERSYGDNNRPERRFGDNNRPERSFDDNNRPERSFGDNNRSEMRSDDNNRSEMRSDDNNRPERRFGDNNRSEMRSDDNDRPRGRECNFGRSSNWQNRSSDYSSPSQDSFKARPSFNSYNSVPPPQAAAPDETKRVQIDWAKIRAAPDQNLNKFKDHPAVVKNFYIEDPSVAAMSYDEAQAFRKSYFDIKVELFKKENLAYCTGPNTKPSDEKTPEELAAYLQNTVPNPVRTFEQAFGAFPDIMAEIRKQKFDKPTPVQCQMWPILTKGFDCVGVAQTGTGKTLAFLLPALIHIDGQPTPRSQRIGPNVLVLSPTRELALQIEQEVKKINYKGMKSVCVYGGGDRRDQIDQVSRGVEIVIGTPGRLYDLIRAGAINVTSVTYLVLDEADKMLDLGFEPQILKILLDIRPDRQTVMTSATWPEGVRRLATKYLREPFQLYVGSMDLRAAKTVRQKLVFIESDEERKERLLEYIETQMGENDKIIVFCGRKSAVDNLSCDLTMMGIVCQAIHGDREQSDREQALEDLKSGLVKILIATDVASRGIDIKDVSCVFNYDFPHNIEEYVHRVGRTGRAGKTGTSVTLVARQDWKNAKELIKILSQGEQEVPQALVDMAERYDKMLKRRAEENELGKGGFRASGSGFGSGGHSRGRGGGFRRNNDFF